MAAKTTIQFMKAHKAYSLALLAYVLFSVIFFACTEEGGPTGPETPQPTTVEGTIFDKLSLPLPGAEISMRSSFSPAETTLTDSRGNYKFVLQWPDTSTKGSVVLTTNKIGYYSKTDSFVVDAGKTYSKSYQLTSRSDTIPPGEASSGIARLVFVSASHSFANVKGVGKRESIVLTFEARDSADIPLDSLHRADIAFKIIPAIGGGEKVAPETTKTSVTLGSNGRIITTLQSGTQAGIVQIQASVVGNSEILATSPAIPIYSGAADSKHFTVALEKLNFPALGLLGVQNKVTVQVGDRWGNPVPESTAIYFTTTGGIIQPAAVTDPVGIAQVTLSSGNTEPSNGFGWVTASTVGDSGKLVKDSIRVLFSGQPIIEPQDFDFEITDGGSVTIPYRVFDKYRHPLSVGERITVTFTGDATQELVFTGDKDITLPDTQDSLFTSFKITATDTVLQSQSSDKGFVMTISVSGPNGSSMRSYLGILRGTGGTLPSSGVPASIILAGLTTNTVSVHGTGQNETAILTFLVRDRSGRPIPQDSATVRFEFVGPDGGATVFPNSARTDAQGRVQTALTSGSVAGVVQIVAFVDTGGASPLSSTPVPVTIAGGLPDQNHFTIAVEKLNIPGLVKAGVTDGITVYVGDKFGNPVQPNTAVYFTTTGGYIEASAFTSTAGIASTTLRSAEPAPPNGFATVTATTVDSSGIEVQNSALVVFSGHPILTVSDESFTVADDSFYTLRFGLHDLNRNPMSGGTTVAVTIGGKNATETELFGDLSTTIPDALYGGYRVDTFAVTVSDKVAGSLKSGEVTLRIDINGPNGSISRLVNGTLLPTRHPKIVSLQLMSDLPRDLSIRGLGLLDSVALMYQIRDSLGQEIHRAGEFVTFEVVEGTSGSFSPQFVYTDADGRAKTTFYSGIYIDTVKFKATVLDVQSTVKTVFILAGPPYPGSARLSVTLPNDTIPKINFARRTSNSEQIAKLRLKVMDKYGNPVKEATPITFTTNAGEILGSSFTDAAGYTSASWYGGSLTPNNGIAEIKALWNNGTASMLLDSISVTYSGTPMISGGLPENTILPNQLNRDVTFKVTDVLGNPLAESAKVVVTLHGSAAPTVLLTGDTVSYTRDTRDTNLTKFTVHVEDTNKTIVYDRILGLKVKVTGKNGSAEYISYDTIKGAIPLPSNAKFLALVGITLSRLSVTGTGGTDQTTLTYELQDSSGAAVPKDGLSVFFDFTGQQGGFEPSSAVTDRYGRVQTVFSTGTIAETVKVFASMGRVTSAKQDIIVLAGPPSRAYFSLAMTKSNDSLPKVNFAGRFNSNKKIGEAHIRLGDKYGNPVANNTKVAFSTSGGFMLDTAYSRNGLVKVDWFGGLPFPSAGTAHIVATTKGQNGVLIGDSLDITYSGQATISGGIGSGFELHQAIDTTFEYVVGDALGSPLAEGATISVTATGAGASSLIFTGDVNVTMGDVNDVENAVFRLNVRDTNTVLTTDRAFQLEIKVAGPNGNATKRTTVILKGKVLPPPPRVAGIKLEQMSATVLTVKEGGGSETSLLTYQIVDSLGNKILQENVSVTFIASGVPASFTPATGVTNANGIVQTLLHSDTVAGIVQVRGKVVATGALSTPANIQIVGGKPSQQYFTFLLTRPGMTGNKVNYPGAMPLDQIIGEAQVQLGDRFGNPVPAGTPVSFTTNAGVIIGSTNTDATGFAKVSWKGGAPNPANGNAIVVARTLGEGGTDEWVKDSARVTYSGQVAIGEGPQQNFQILGAGSMTFSFTVRDANGNPPAEGTRIIVNKSGSGANAVLLTGDVDVTMTDTRDSSLSRFYVTVRDTSTFSSAVRSLGLSINVSGPNGNAVQNTNGSVLATGGGRSRLPGSIALISTSATEIQVAGTGGIETSTMIFELRDSLGVPVDSSFQVKFTLMPSLGGAFISPDSGFSDPQTGRITSVIHSGTVSGTVQVRASIYLGDGTLFTTNPVKVIIHAGQPDQSHFTIGATKLNIEGLDINSVKDTISIILGDKYGNPVPESTAVYFSSNIGIIAAEGFTDATGSASVILYSGNPRSSDGFGYVTASTVGENGQSIRDSIRILFSGPPIIDSVRFEPNAITDFVLRFKVYDRNKNPMAFGNLIQVTGEGDVSLLVSRVFPQSRIPDTQDPFWTEYYAVFSLNRYAQPIKLGAFTGAITVSGPNGTAVHTFPGVVDTLARPNANVYGLRLLSATNKNITVKDAGGLQTSVLTYEIIDSVEHTIKRPGVEVTFINDGVSGSFTPETTVTDANGQIQVTFHSGTQAGNARIRAKLVGSDIASIPYSIGIVGGKPAQESFSVMVTAWNSAPKNPQFLPLPLLNVPGAVHQTQPIAQVRALVGDRYGNPVPSGTIIYFTTNAGIVVGSDTTDVRGVAVADWMAGNPLPPGGLAVIKASALGENNTVVIDSATAVYSGSPVISNGLPEGFILPFGFDTTLTYKVSDINGNPIAAGARIDFELSGDGSSQVLLTGNYLVDPTKDTKDTNDTNFKVRLRDGRPVGNIANNLSLDVKVASTANGNAFRSVSGIMGATGVTGRTRLPGSIALISTSSQEIQVAGTGGIETSTLIFEVRDSLGTPVDSAYEVQFFVQPDLGGAFISPVSGFNNPQTGRITCVVHSGSVSGPIQVLAKLGAAISSAPVRILVFSGHADQAHFSIGASVSNVPGLDINGKENKITVIAGDKFGNPVQSSTAIYFGTNIGIITTNTGYTDPNGMAVAAMFSGNPRSSDGFGYVTASTVGEGGSIVKDSVRILFSGFPIIDSLQLIPNDTTDFIASFRVYDRNHNPLAAETQIMTEIIGNVSLVTPIRVYPSELIPDTQDPFWTKFYVPFSFDRSNTNPDFGPFTVKISVIGPNGSIFTNFNAYVAPPSITPTPTKSIAQLNLVSQSASQLTVKQAGGTETSLLTFQLADSSGASLSRSGVLVNFDASGANGTLSAGSAYTDALGQVMVTFRSDTVVGNAYVVAKIASSSITADSVLITISGGKAVQDRMTLILTRPNLNGAKVNFPGAAPFIQTIGTAQVQIGDRYGNPVSNALVYFSSNAGVIGGQAVTNSSGFASVSWYGGNPIPANGVAMVSVSTRGEAGDFVTVKDTVTYSGLPIVSGWLSNNFNLRNGIDTVINFSVLDANGNPLAEGATVSITASGDGASTVALSGDIDVTMIDTRDFAEGSFAFRIQDFNDNIADIRSLKFTVSVSGANGSVSKSATGTLEGTAGAPSPVPPRVAGIRWVSSSASNLTVKNTGGIETSTIIFEVLDSVGNVIPTAGLPLKFTHIGAYGRFSPDTSFTNGFGSAQVVFKSDTISGVVNVYAQTLDGSVQSSPVQLVIVGGRPNSSYFTFIVTRTGEVSRKVNYPGAMPLVQQIGTAMVQVGDRYGNPVPTGTSISFGTNAGLIQGTAMTDENGFASVKWYGGNPLPAGGVAVITASAIGEAGTISEKDTVTYSGQALASGGPNDGFQLNSSVAQTFSYTVNDANSNPIAEGSKITVSLSGTASKTAVLTGDVDVSIPDTRALSATQYSFTVKDTSTTSTIARSLQVVISVTGPNGSASLTRTGQVLPAGAGDTSRSRLPGSIAFLSISNPQIQVIGTGGTETTTLRFEVRDSLGIPVDSTYKVLFSFPNSPGGGEFITPEVGYTDAATGQISAIVSSGTRSGVLQVLAAVVTPTDTIFSEISRVIIHSGLPDQTHFSISLSPVNLPGLVYDARTSTVTTIVGDKYGNPVPSGTAVYFTTSSGIVTTNNGFTDTSGFAKVTLYSGNPRGVNGFGYVKGFTIGTNGTTITDSARVLFSGYPIVTYTGPATFTMVAGGSTSFDVTVADMYGNPITQKSEISIIATSESDIGVSSEYTLGDTQLQGSGSTDFSFTITDIIEDTPIGGPVAVKIKIIWEGQTFEVPIASGTIN